MVMTSTLALMELVGIAELASLLKVSRTRADQLARQVGFPAPVASLSGGRVWDKSAVEAWMRDVGRLK